MLISATVLWYVLALVIAGIEMLVGTVYLLVVAAACAAGGTASYFGLAAEWQFAVSAVVTLAGSVLVRHLKSEPDEPAARLMELDNGQVVRVEGVGTDGLAVVQYRGAPWIARANEGVLTKGSWLIDRVDGAQLVLKPLTGRTN